MREPVSLINNRIFLYNNILDKTSHFITQQCCRAYGDGRRGCDGGGRWHTLFSCSVLHDSLLKENRHFMQALINKTPWVAVYPAFFVNLINVYQTRGVSRTSCAPWSPTTTLPHHKNLQLSLLALPCTST